MCRLLIACWFMRMAMWCTPKSGEKTGSPTTTSEHPGPSQLTHIPTEHLKELLYGSGTPFPLEVSDSLNSPVFLVSLGGRIMEIPMKMDTSAAIIEESLKRMDAALRHSKKQSTSAKKHRSRKTKA